MNCRDLTEFLQEYFAGELPSPVASAFAAHLQACGNCGVFLEQYRRTITLGQVLVTEGEAVDVPEDLIQAIVTSLRAAD